MATLANGILGGVRGKVGGVVGAQWKDKNYIRAYVLPGNPNTPAQQAQRSKMRDAVAFVRPLVGSVMNRFMDPFLKSLSGYNRFIQLNVARFVDLPFFGEIQLVDGKLIPMSQLAISNNPAPDMFDITWDTSTIAVDYEQFPVHIMVYNINTKIWSYFLDPAVVLINGTITVDVVTNTLDNLVAYVWYSQTVNNVLTNVAISASAEVSST
jgi:hypothetical protein